MAQDHTVADPHVVLDLLEAFRRSKTMFAAVELELFDTLARGPKTVTELAETLQLNADALERLLDSCVVLQLLTRDDGRYANAPAAATYLTSDHPRRLTGYVRYSNRLGWDLWKHLEDAVREGTHRWKQAFGTDGPIFSHFFQNEDSKRDFLMGMHGFGMISSPQVVAAFDLSRYQHFVDLGGATGHLAIAACERYSTLRATVFDLPEAIGLAREIIDQSPVAQRVDLVAGDFFTDPLPAGDLYALGRIVHDWSPEKIDRLLARIVAALPVNGSLLIAEKVLFDDKTGPRWAQMQNLNMLSCTEGKERTIGEYEQILRRAGFAEVALCRTSSPLDAVLATKRS